MSIICPEYQCKDFQKDFDAHPDMISYPWVGKHYKKTRVMILGRNCDQNKGGDSRDSIMMKKGDATNQRTVVWVWGEENPFEYKNTKRRMRAHNTMVRMFTAGKPTTETRQKFWKAVAFNNFWQEIPNSKSPKKCKSVEESRKALRAVLTILRPKLVICWETRISHLGLPKEIHKRDKISGAIPRWINPEGKDPAVAGIRHPGRSFSSDKWLSFLQEDAARRDAIAGLMEHCIIT